MNSKLIKKTLKEVYDFDPEEVTQEQITGFEHSNLYNENLLDSPRAYCKSLVQYLFMQDKMDNLHEDSGGMAMATAGNTSGMGAVVTPSAGSIPGVPNGTTGSGDVGAGKFPNVRSRDSHLPRSRRKAKAKAAAKSIKKSLASNNPFLNPVQKAPSVKTKASSVLSFNAFKESLEIMEEQKNKGE